MKNLRSDIEEQIKGVLLNYDLDAKKLSTNASFVNDLDLDSLDFAEFILTVEEAFDITIYCKNNKIKTIGNLVSVIENILNTRFINKT